MGKSGTVLSLLMDIVRRGKFRVRYLGNETDEGQLLMDCESAAPAQDGWRIVKFAALQNGMWLRTQTHPEKGV